MPAPKIRSTTEKLLRVFRSLVRPRRIWIATAIVLSVLSRDGLAESPRWQMGGDDCQLKVVDHTRIDRQRRRPAHDHLRVHSAKGTYAYAVFPIEPTTVISELEIHQRVKSNRSNLQLHVRMILPRASDDGKPMSLMISGSSYQSPGTWETLTIPDIASELEQQVRILRSQTPGRTVDMREAFVDLIILDIYGGPGPGEIYLQDPSVEGSASIRRNTYAQPISLTTRKRRPAEEETVHIERHGDVMVLNDRPLFVRMAQDHGEDWSFVKSLGFNTLRLSKPATAKQVLRAERLGLWLVTPPPPRWPTGSSSRLYRRVLAWDGGEGLTFFHLAARKALIRNMKAADSARRPILLGPAAELAAYSRHADILMHRRLFCEFSQSPAAYHRWLKDRQQLTLNNSVHWASIPTEPDSHAILQIEAFGFDVDSHPFMVQPHRVDELVTAAVTAGVRGLEFRASTRLDADSETARLRAAHLKLVNLRLDLMEPWLSAGRIATGASCDDEHCQFAVLQTDRAWLVLLSRSTRSPADNRVEITIPGVAESVEAFLVDHPGIQRLTHQRIAGGIRLSWEAGQSNMVVVSREPLVIRQLESRIVSSAASTSELYRQVADTLCQRTARRIGSQGFDDSMRKRAERELFQTRRWIDMCQESMDAGRFLAASQLARQAYDQVQLAQAFLQKPEISGHNATSAMGMYFETLPWAHKFHTTTLAGASTINLLASGGFDDTDSWHAAPWRIEESPTSSVQTEVSPSQQDPHDGDGCLLLATSQIGGGTERRLEAAPLLMESPAIPLRRGQVIRIDGWIDVPEEIRGSHDGVMIFDSLGGPSLAQHFYRTSGWQRFTFFRAASTATDWKLNIALTGLGRVRIDSLSVSLVDHRTADLANGTILSRKEMDLDVE